MNGKSALLGLCASLLGAGCSQVLDLDSYGDSADGSGLIDAMGKGGAARDAAAHADRASMPARETGTTDAYDESQETSDAHLDTGVSCGSIPGFVCTALPPTGWTGPLAIFEGSGEPLPSVPPCTTLFPTDAYDGFDVPNAPSPACSCSCGSPSGAECEGTATFFGGGVCTNTCGKASTLPPGGCATVNLAGCPGGEVVVSIGVSASGGTCVGSPSTDVSPWTWAREVRACGTSSPLGTSSCGADEACAPVPALPYEAGNVCVAHVGSWTCPGAFPNPHVYYGGASDTRACSTCSCGDATGVVCGGGTIESYSDGACEYLLGSSTLPQSCEGRSPYTASMGLTGVTASGGTCAPSAVTPTGGVSAEQPTTLCCLR